MACSFYQAENAETHECETRWVPLLLVWTFINVAPMWWVIYANKRSAYRADRDKGYEPFVRRDYNNWSYVQAIFTHFFFIPRFAVGWSAFWILAIIACILAIGYDPKKLPQWRQVVVRRLATIAAYIICWCAGIHPRRKRIDADYTKYLGPGYNKTYDGAGIHVSSHMSGFDPMIHWAVHFPQCGFLGKKEGEKIPGGKQLVGPMGHLLVGRDKRDSREELNKLIEDIKARQLEAEKGEAMPLCIFPEGATSNGTHILTFQRGAFLSLRKVKPHFCEYWSPNGVSPCHGDAINFVAHILVCIHTGFSMYNVCEMPVFEPNEYFWANHWDGKEEKWQAYARAVRQVMMDASGLKDTQLSMKNKLEYKDLVRGKKKKTQ